MCWIWGWNETTLDESAGRTETYVEDCQIYCQPHVLHARYHPKTQKSFVEVELE